MAHHSEEDDIEFEANFSGKEEAEIRTRLIALQEKSEKLTFLSSCFCAA